jgi:hypothetical protein
MSQKEKFKELVISWNIFYEKKKRKINEKNLILVFPSKFI